MCRQITSVPWVVPYFPQVIQIAVFAFVICIFAVLYVTIGVVSQIAGVFRGLILDARKQMSEGSAVERSAQVVSIGIYAVLLLPFWLIELPFLFIGSLWSSFRFGAVVLIIVLIGGIYGLWVYRAQLSVALHSVALPHYEQSQVISRSAQQQVRIAAKAAETVPAEQPRSAARAEAKALSVENMSLPAQQQVHIAAKAAETVPAEQPRSAARAEAKALSVETAMWLVQRIAVTTKEGITGFLPGTRVTLIEDHGKKLLVSDGSQKFEVTRAQVTTDVAVARSASASDYAAQNAIAMANAQREAEAAKKEEEKTRAQERRPGR